MQFMNKNNFYGIYFAVKYDTKTAAIRADVIYNKFYYFRQYMLQVSVLAY